MFFANLQQIHIRTFFPHKNVLNCINGIVFVCLHNILYSKLQQKTCLQNKLVVVPANDRIYFNFTFVIVLLFELKMLTAPQKRTFSIIFFAMYLVVYVDCGSCRDSSLCCNGRDSSCVVQNAPINSIIDDLIDKPCYCDHACLKLGDCCADFKQHCDGKYYFFFKCD